MRLFCSWVLAWAVYEDHSLRWCRQMLEVGVDELLLRWRGRQVADESGRRPSLLPGSPVALAWYEWLQEPLSSWVRMIGCDPGTNSSPWKSCGPGGFPCAAGGVVLARMLLVLVPLRLALSMAAKISGHRVIWMVAVVQTAFELLPWFDVAVRYGKLTSSAGLPIALSCPSVVLLLGGNGHDQRAISLTELAGGQSSVTAGLGRGDHLSGSCMLAGSAYHRRQSLRQEARWGAWSTSTMPDLPVALSRRGVALLVVLLSVVPWIAELLGLLPAVTSAA